MRLTAPVALLTALLTIPSAHVAAGATVAAPAAGALPGMISFWPRRRDCATLMLLAAASSVTVR